MYLLQSQIGKREENFTSSTLSIVKKRICLHYLTRGKYMNQTWSYLPKHRKIKLVISKGKTMMEQNGLQPFPVSLGSCQLHQTDSYRENRTCTFSRLLRHAVTYVSPIHQTGTARLPLPLVAFYDTLQQTSVLFFCRVLHG